MWGWSVVLNCVVKTLQKGRSYQEQREQVAAPPDRIQSHNQGEQKSRKREQKRAGFHMKRELTDHNPAESPPQWKNLRQNEAKPEGHDTIWLLAVQDEFVSKKV